MDIAMAASRSLSRQISVAADKPILRGIHHLANAATIRQVADQLALIVSTVLMKSS